MIIEVKYEKFLKSISFHRIYEYSITEESYSKLLFALLFFATVCFTIAQTITQSFNISNFFSTTLYFIAGIIVLLCIPISNYLCTLPPEGYCIVKISEGGITETLNNELHFQANWEDLYVATIYKFIQRDEGHNNYYILFCVEAFDIEKIFILEALLGNATPQRRAGLIGKCCLVHSKNKEEILTAYAEVLKYVDKSRIQNKGPYAWKGMLAEDSSILPEMEPKVSHE